MRGMSLFQFLVPLLILTGAQNNRTISDVYVNLPATCSECRKVRYEISAYNGCYDWVTFNPQIISLEKVKDESNCFNKAVLMATVSRPIKTVVIIKATDLNTKEALTSQVKVSRLSEIRILTNFKAIDVDDVQKLYIQAFDDSNNVISSAEGLRFEWRIETNPHALKVISSKEANYENTPVRLEMEQKRQQTDLILVRGIQTGIVEVSARILEKDYEEVAKARISIVVIEPFFLIPDKPVYLLTNSDFTYRIAKGKRQVNGRAANQYKEVQLPDSQYRFISGDYRMLIVKDSGLVHTMDKIGEVLVRVKDTTLDNNTVEGLIYVVDPDMLDLAIRDVTKEFLTGRSLNSILSQADICEHEQIYNWNLVVNHVYAVTSCLFDNSKNMVTITGDSSFELTYSQTHLKFLAENRQRSVVVVEAIEPELKGIHLRSVLATKNEFRNRAFADKEIKIFSQVKVSHPYPTILLPYLARVHISQVPQMWTLSCTGGSGTYKWESLNSDIVSVTNQGIIYGLRLGMTKVAVSDALNSFNNNTINVEVTRVDRFEFIEEKMELPVGSKETLSVMAFDNKGRKFTNCTEIPLNWIVKDESMIKLREEGQRPYEEIKKYVNGPNKELIKLKFSYEKKEFNEFEQLHNLFGICGQRTIATLGEGMGRVITEIFINEDDGTSYKRESDQELILVYRPLNTISPSYEQFLKPLKLDERDESYRRYLQQFKSENEYVLGYGGGLFWEISGGTFNWIDLPSHYSEEIKIEKTMGGKGIDLEIMKMNGESIKNSRREHYLACPIPDSTFFSNPADNEFKLTLKAGNKPAKSLLRPAENEISIVVSCQVPLTMKLAWAQRDLAHYESLPRKESENSYEVDTYFVKNGQSFNTRVLVFDKYRRIFYNFSSYEREMKITDQSLGYVRPLQPYYLYDLTTTEKTGSFFVEGGLIGLKQKSWQVLDLSKIKDKMKINNVNMLRIEPTYKLLYLSDKNTLTIRLIDGSGNFNIRSNTSDIVSIQYDASTSARIVSITPLKEGYVSVIVEDRGVSTGVTAKCAIAVSGINRILLKQDQLLEHKTSAKIQISYESFDGQPLPMEQYGLISVTLVQKRKRTPSGIIPENAQGLVITPAKDLTPDFYNVYADEVGGYEIIASVRSPSMTEIYSNPIYIEVFPSLKIYPPGLLLMPDGGYTLKISGGPFSVSMESEKSRYGGAISKSFQSADTSIAEVNPVTGEVKARRVGDTTIEVTLTQEFRDHFTNGLRYESLCKRSIPISIRLVTDVEIVGINKRSILSGATIKLVGLLKNRNESFTHAIYPVEYYWTTKQISVFSLKSSKKTEDSSIQGDQPSIEGMAQRAGEADIMLHVIISYPEIYRNEVREFSTSAVLRVLSPLYGTVPNFIDTPLGQTATYLLPPKCMHRFPSNKENNMKLSYSQMCTPAGKPYSVISISEENLVTTSEHYGSATIIAEEVTFDPLRTAYYVEVAPIHSVVIQRSASIVNLPAGADISLKLVYQDKLGRSFADLVEGIGLMIDVSHPGVIRADLDYYNNTLTVRALSLGTSMIHVYMKHYILDLVKVHVTSVIESSSQVFVHVGGTVQFKGMQDYSNVQWSSEDTSILEVDPKTGLGKALREGSTNVNLGGITRVNVICGRINDIALNMETSPKTLTNVVSDSQYKSVYSVQLKLYGNDYNAEVMPIKETAQAIVKQGLHLECKPLEPDWITAKVDDSKDVATCLIYPKSGPSSMTPPSTVTIEVSVGSKDVGYTKTERFSFPFGSGFGVIGSKDLVFSKTSRSKIIKVSGSNSIRAWAEDSSLCDIRVINEETYSEVYVTIPRDIIKNFKNLKLYIENVRTGQKEVVNLSYYNDDFDPEDNNNKKWGIIDIMTIAVLIITLLIIAKYFLWPRNSANARNPRHYQPPADYHYRSPIGGNVGYKGLNSQNMFSNFIC